MPRRTCSAGAGATCSSARSPYDRSRNDTPQPEPAPAPLERDRRLRERLRRALGPPPPSVPDRPLRPREHGAGGLVDRARPPAGGHGAPRGRDLAPGLPLRPDPARVDAALARVAEPGLAARCAGHRSLAGGAAGLLARPQARRLRARGRRLRPRVPALPRDAVADPERVPPGRARVPAAAVRDLVPR